MKHTVFFPLQSFSLSALSPPLSLARFASLSFAASVCLAMIRVGNVCAEATQPVFDGLLAMCGPVKVKHIYKDKR